MPLLSPRLSLLLITIIAGVSPALAGPNPIATFELVEKELFIRVYEHAIDTFDGPIPCWTYVTKGLANQGQKEIVITVKKYPELTEVEAPGLFFYFKVVHHLASKGKYVDVGDYTAMAEEIWFLKNNALSWVLYTHEQRFEGVDYPDTFLLGLILPKEEGQLLRSYGPTRIMSLLGNVYRYYPTIAWSDRRRTPVIDRDTMKKSVLSQIFTTAFPNVSVTHHVAGGENDQDRLVLTLTPLASEKLPGYLADDSMELATLCLPDPNADASYVWWPNKPDRWLNQEMGSQARARTGNFILFQRNEEQNAGLFLEDGFVMQLTSKDYERVIVAIADGKPLFIPADGDHPGLEIRFHAPAYPATGLPIRTHSSPANEPAATESLAKLEQRLFQAIGLMKEAKDAQAFEMLKEVFQDEHIDSEGAHQTKFMTILYLGRLRDRIPAARQLLAARRDEIAAQLKPGEVELNQVIHLFGPYTQFNNALGESEKSLERYYVFKNANDRVHKIMFPLIQDQLLERRDYEEFLSIGADKRIDKIFEIWESTRKTPNTNPKSPAQATKLTARERSFVKQLGNYYQSFLGSGQTEKAAHMAERLATVNASAETWRALAWSGYLSGKPVKANLKQAQFAMKQSGCCDIAAIKTLALVMDGLGMKKEAIEFLEKAKLDIEDPEDQKSLDQILADLSD